MTVRVAVPLTHDQTFALAWDNYLAAQEKLAEAAAPFIGAPVPIYRKRPVPKTADRRIKVLLPDGRMISVINAPGMPGRYEVAEMIPLRMGVMEISEPYHNCTLTELIRNVCEIALQERMPD